MECCEKHRTNPFGGLLKKEFSENRAVVIFVFLSFHRYFGVGLFPERLDSKIHAAEFLVLLRFHRIFTEVGFFACREIRHARRISRNQ